MRYDKIENQLFNQYEHQLITEDDMDTTQDDLNNTPPPEGNQKYTVEQLFKIAEIPEWEEAGIRIFSNCPRGRQMTSAAFEEMVRNFRTQKQGGN